MEIMANEVKIMSKRLVTILAMAVIVIGTISGFILSDIFNSVNSDRKPVIEVNNKVKVVKPDTNIVHERAYEKCGHTVVSRFNQTEDLQGKSLDEIRKIYSPELGYSIDWQGDTIIVHQRINQLCPADKEIYRLKEYQGMVAVYRGTEEEEVLERITEIRMELLPASVQEDIRSGKFVFKDRATLNDALENFDEYL